MRTGNRTQYGPTRGFTLIETLVCAVIISILVTISVVSYQGALDQSDLKYALPQLARKLDDLRRSARDQGYTITVTFDIGKTTYSIVQRKGEEVVNSSGDLKADGLIRRPLKFRRYEWPDGGDSPATFTFAGHSEPQAGKLIVGTGNAEGAILIVGGNVYYQLS